MVSLVANFRNQGSSTGFLESLQVHHEEGSPFVIREIRPGQHRRLSPQDPVLGRPHEFGITEMYVSMCAEVEL
jgi:hypothetical protein